MLGIPDACKEKSALARDHTRAAPSWVCSRTSCILMSFCPRFKSDPSSLVGPNLTKCNWETWRSWQWVKSKTYLAEKDVFLVRYSCMIRAEFTRQSFVAYINAKAALISAWVLTPSLQSNSRIWALLGLSLLCSQREGICSRFLSTEWQSRLWNRFTFRTSYKWHH